MKNIFIKYLRRLYFLLRYNLFVKPALKNIKRTSYKGFNFIIYPSVFHPLYFVSSKVFAKFVSGLELKDKNILDMGSGSGIISIFSASKGAICTAVDINPMAVRSILENAEHNGFKEKITVIESDLYESIPSPLGRAEVEFDIIFFNPPYYKGKPKNNFERAFKGGENLEVVRRFAEQSSLYLKPGGIVYMILSSDVDIDEFKKIFSHYSFDIVTNINRFFETFYICKLVIDTNKA